MIYYVKRTYEIILRSPLSIPRLIFTQLICKIRSSYYSRKIDKGGGKIIITSPFILVKVKKHKSSTLFIKGRLRIIPHIGGNSPIIISMKENSTLQIDGDFVIGQGVRFFLSSNASLKIGGKDKESDSGITADTLIMVSKRIEIGKDFLCAWNIFISDSDWHYIKDEKHQADIEIGDHVWIANSNNILKGSKIGNNCIVASNSKILNRFFPDNVLIGGVPSKILKTNIEWSRDI